MQGAIVFVAIYAQKNNKIEMMASKLFVEEEVHFSPSFSFWMFHVDVRDVYI